MLFRTVGDWGVPYKLMHQESELDRSLRCLLYKVKGTFYTAHGQRNDHEVVYMELEGDSDASECYNTYHGTRGDLSCR